MKKLIAIMSFLMLAGVSFVLVGCNNSNNETDVENNNEIMTGETKKEETKKETKDDEEKKDEMVEDKESSKDIDLEDAKDGYSWHTDTKNGFALQYPNTRETQENQLGTLVMFLSEQNEGDDFRENINVSMEDLGQKMDIEDYMESANGYLEQIITDYESISIDKTKLGGEKAMYHVYKGKMGVFEIQRKQIVTIHDKKAYVVTYTSKIDTFENFQKQLDTMVNSFKFIK